MAPSPGSDTTTKSSLRSTSASTPTTSPLSHPPISPFSIPSNHSEPTSDEIPDLGSFPSVFRALTYLQPIRVPNISINMHNQRSSTSVASVTGSSVTNPTRTGTTQSSEPRSTVWAYPNMATYLASTAGAPSSNGSSTVHSLANDSRSGVVSHGHGLMSPFRFPARSQSMPRVPSTIPRQHDTDDDEEYFLDEEEHLYRRSRRTVVDPRTGQFASDSAYDSGSIIEDDEDEDDSEARPVEIEDIDERDLSFNSSPLDNDIDEDDGGDASAYDSDELNHQQHKSTMLLDQEKLTVRSSPKVFVEQDSSIVEEDSMQPVFPAEEEEDQNDINAGYPPSAPNLSHSLPSPSLGILESALSYLAAERERFAASQRASVTPPNCPSLARKAVTAPVTPSRSFLPPPSKKKRQRKRKVPVTAPLPGAPGSKFDESGRKAGVGSGEADDSSSSVDPITTTTDAEKRSNPTTSSPSKSTTNTHAPLLDQPTHRGRTSQRATLSIKSRAAKTKKTISTQDYPNYAPPVMHILKHSRSTPTLSRLSPSTANTTSLLEVETTRTREIIKEVVSSSSSAPRAKRNKRQRQQRLIENVNEVQVEENEEEDKDEMHDSVLDDQEFNMEVLKKLTSKLQAVFPEDKRTLKGAAQRLVEKAQSTPDVEGSPGSGWEGEGGKPYYHVFIDHSNILIGMLNHSKKRTTRGHHRHRSSNSGYPGFITQSLPPTTVLSKSSPSPYTNLSSSPEKAILYASPSSYSSSSPLAMSSMRQNKSSSTGIGFTPLNTSPTKPLHHSYRRHLRHTSLALLLERGRNVTRRVCVASSPLHQPKETVERLGYDFKVLKRVLVDDVSSSSTPASGGAVQLALHNPFEGNAITTPSPSAPIPIKGGKKGIRKGAHARKQSGSASYDSEQQPMLAPASAAANISPSAHTQTHLNTPHRPAPASHSASFPSSSTFIPPSRPRYHEQGVDELLQLKLHQSLNITDSSPPPGSTIILATGDGNAGEFNEEGFVGPVGIALRRGWRVELYAWEDGLSRVWRRVFEEWLEDENASDADSPKRGMFKIVGLEQFGAELVKWIL